jgi:hypothetical protein
MFPWLARAQRRALPAPTTISASLELLAAQMHCRAFVARQLRFQIGRVGLTPPTVAQVLPVLRAHEPEVVEYELRLHLAMERR